MAYRIVFLQSHDPVPRGWFLRRLFGPPKPAAQIVLADLAWRCRANASTVAYTATGAVDPIQSAFLAGKRDVWLVIQKFLNIDPSTLLEKEEPPHE